MSPERADDGSNAFEALLPPALSEPTQPGFCGGPNLAAYTPGRTGNVVVHDAP